MISTKFKSALLAVTVLTSLLMAPFGAQATPSVDTSQLNMAGTPGVTAPTTYELKDDGQVCFVFSGGSAKTLYFQDAGLTYNIIGEPFSYNESLYYTVQKDGTSFNLCLYPVVGTGFVNATGVAFTGTLKQGTTISSNFETYLASKGLTLKDTYFWFNGTNTQFEMTVENTSTKALGYNVTDVLIDGKVTVNAPTAIVVPAKAESWIRLGEVAGDYEKNYANLSITMNLTVSPFSKLISTKVKLPKGLSVVSNSATSWDYPSYNRLQPGESITRPCLLLKNTSGKAISVMSTLSWKSGSSSSTGNFGELLPIAKNGIICASGLDSNDKFLTGDLRLGQTVTVTGSVSIVAQSSVVTSGLKLGGYRLTQKPWVSYDAATKSTQVVIYVTHSTLEGDALLKAPKINGVQTDAAVVAGRCECGGPGYDYRSRTLVLTKVKGDLRVGKTLKLTGTLQNSTPLTYSYTGSGLQSDDGNYGCTLYHPEIDSKYDGKTNITDFKIQCYNSTSVAHSIDLSALTALAEEPGQPNRNYTAISGLSNLSLPANMPWTATTVFQLLGEWRTGAKTLTISGNAILR